MAVGRVKRRRAAPDAVEAVDDVVRDAVALLLAEHQVARQLGVLRIVGDQVAQQQGGALDVAAGLLKQVEHPGVGTGAQQRHPTRP